MENTISGMSIPVLAKLFPITNQGSWDAQSRTFKVCTEDVKVAIKALANALYCYKKNEKLGVNSTLTYNFSCKGKQGRLVSQALATLHRALDKNIEVLFLENGHPVDMNPPDFSKDKIDWEKTLEAQEGAILPCIVRKLDAQVDDRRSLRWYRGLRNKKEEWSGRVLGLGVCECKAGDKISFVVEKMDKGVRDRFCEIVGNRPPEFGPDDDISGAVNLIRKLIEDRRKEKGPLGEFEPELKLQACVISGELDLGVPGFGKLSSIIPQDKPLFPFPTRWFIDSLRPGKPKFTDCIMVNGCCPWVVEFKVKPKNRNESYVNEYYRFGIIQAVLYREYIRHANVVANWFRKKQVDPSKCEAVVAIPSLTSKELEDLKMIAGLFEVYVVNL